jgi:hypothetical protein
VWLGLFKVVAGDFERGFYFGDFSPVSKSVLVDSWRLLVCCYDIPKQSDSALPKER